MENYLDHSPCSIRTIPAQVTSHALAEVVSWLSTSSMVFCYILLLIYMSSFVPNNCVISGTQSVCILRAIFSESMQIITAAGTPIIEADRIAKFEQSTRP